MDGEKNNMTEKRLDDSMTNDSVSFRLSRSIIREIKCMITVLEDRCPYLACVYSGTIIYLP